MAPEAQVQVDRSGFYAAKLSGSPSSRDRILAAVVELLAARGFENTTPQMVFDRAGVVAERFSGEFESVEAAALAALDEMGARYLPIVERAFLTTPGGWRDKLRAAVFAAAEALRENPVDARFAAYETMRMGGAARALRDRLLVPVVEMVDSGRREMDPRRRLSRATAEAVVGSFVDALVRQITFERPTDPREYVPQMMYLAVRPYLGSEAAEEELLMLPSA
ncbi:MAG TPA: TetR/AcrR family transcriptional regulator [Solirubrobacterales bacterium]|nr:TetR/AcrR family transcriptional regulator [Solirubrobacterales bacterium]